MTTLADLRPGEQVLFAFQVTAADGTGVSLDLYGPAAAPAGAAVIAPDGAMTGQLAQAPDQTPVTVVTGFAPVSVGDVLANEKTGETMVARWSQIDGDGTVTWSSATAHQVVYPAAGWAVIGHIDLP